jgi:hypothetical protein
VLLSPLVFMLSLAIVRGATLTDLRASGRIVVPLTTFGMLLMLPVLLFYWIAFLLLRHRTFSERGRWAILSITGSLAIWLTYYGYDTVFFRQGGFGVYAWPLSYSVVLCLVGALVGRRKGSRHLLVKE